MNNDWGSIDLYTVTHCDTTTRLIKQVDEFEMHAYFDILLMKFNPLSPKSDQHQISLCNMNAL